MLNSVRIVTLTIGLTCAGCVQSHVVVPAAGGSVGRANQAGLTLNVAPNSWRGDPSDLDQYVTPIWVQVINRTKREVRVIYSDLALTNSEGFRYSILNPYPVRTEVKQHHSSLLPSRPDALVANAEVARRSGSEWALDTGSSADDAYAQLIPHGGESASIDPVRYMGRGGRPHFHGGFGIYAPYPYPPYYAPWPYFGYGSYYYGPFVRYWDAPYYAQVLPTEDMLRRGLPEGVLQAGGNIAGYVYFQNVPNKADRLDLAWAAHDAAGNRLAELRIPLSVIED